MSRARLRAIGAQLKAKAQGLKLGGPVREPTALEKIDSGEETSLEEYRQGLEDWSKRYKET